MGRVQNIHPVDRFDIDLSDSDLNPGNRVNRIAQRFALKLGQLLGVVDRRQRRAARKYNGSGHHRTGQRTAADLIDTGDKTKPLRPAFSFQAEEFVSFGQKPVQDLTSCGVP